MNTNIIFEMEDGRELTAVEACAEDGMLLEYVEKQNKAIQLAAVTQNAYALRYAKNPGIEVVVAALTTNSIAECFVSDKIWKRITHADDKLAKKIQGWKSKYTK